MPTFRLALRLGLRDLRGGLGSLRILVAGIAIGVAAIAAVGAFAGALLDHARAGAREAIGADVSLRLFHRAPTAEERAFLSAAGRYVEIVALRTRASPAEGGRGTLVELEGVGEGWPLYGEVGLTPDMPLDEVLATRDGLPGVAVDAALLAGLGLAPGDRLRLGSLSVRIAAVLDAEPGGTLRPFSLGPRVLVARTALVGTPLLRPGAPVYWYGLVRLPAGTAPDAWLRALDARFPDAGWRVVVAADGIPGLERTVRIAEVLLTLAGLAVLLVGGVGVAAAVRAHIDARMHTVAVLRGIGAGRGLVLGMVLAQVGMATGLAVAVGLGLGGAAVAFAVSLAGLSGGAAAAWQPGAFGLAAVSGLLAALMFSLWSTGRLAAASPQRLFRALVAPVPHRRGGRLAATGLAAAALFGLAAAATGMPVLASAFALAALLAGAVFAGVGAALAALARRFRPRRRPLLRLALGSLSRPGAATVPLVAALGLTLTVVTTVATVEGNARRHLESTLPASAPDLAVVDLPAGAVSAFDALVDGLPAVERHARMPFLHARVTHLKDRRLDPASVPRDVAWVVRGDRGLSWAAEPPPGTEIVAGDWWPADHAGAPLASVDAAAARRLGIGVGDRLTLDVLGRPLTATVANLRRIDWSRLGLDFPVLITPPAEPPPHGHLAAVWLAPAAGAGAVEAVEAAVAARFPDSPTVRLAPVIERIGGLVAGASGVLAAVSAIVGAAAAAVMAGTVAADYRRRLRDVVLLRLLGARRRQLVLASVIEMAAIGATAALPATLLGTALGRAVVAGLAPEGWVLLPAVPVTIVLVAVAGALLAGWLLPRRALARSPAAWLRADAAG